MYIAQFLSANNDIELEHEANGNVILYGDREFTWTYGRSLASVLDGMDEKHKGTVPLCWCEIALT